MGTSERHQHQRVDRRRVIRVRVQVHDGSNGLLWKNKKDSGEPCRHLLNSTIAGFSTGIALYEARLLVSVFVSFEDYFAHDNT